MDEDDPRSSGTFLKRLLNMHAENPEKISMADIFTTCITNIGAGSDTTSISLTAILYNLSKHASIYQKVLNFLCFPQSGRLMIRT